MAYTSAGTGVKGTTVAQTREAIDLLMTQIAAASAASSDAFRSVSYANNTLSFFTNAAGTGTAAATVNLPKELFLDQTKTVFVPSFAFQTGGVDNYTGATNPNLEGKPVMVLAVKGEDNSIAYSFLDMSTLVDTYSAADASVTVSGYTIGVNISATAGNALTLNPDGLHVPAAPVMATDNEFDEMLVDVGLLTASSGGSD